MYITYIQCITYITYITYIIYIIYITYIRYIRYITYITHIHTYIHEQMDDTDEKGLSIRCGAQHIVSFAFFSMLRGVQHIKYVFFSSRFGVQHIAAKLFTYSHQGGETIRGAVGVPNRGGDNSPPPTVLDHLLDHR